MHRVFAVLIPALVLGPMDAGAQGAAGGVRGRLALEVGALRQGIDDRMASPVRYAGGAPVVGVAYAGWSGAWRWAARGAVTFPRLTSRVTTAQGGYEETAWTLASAELVRRVWDGGAGNVWIGPGVDVAAGVRRHVYETDTWLNFSNAFAALQAVARAELELGRAGGLSETLALPLVGVAVRKAYASVILRERQVYLAVPPGFLMARHRLVYRVPGRGSVGARVFHEALLLRHTEPLDLATVVHRLGVAVDWRWGTP